jgi:hypothetical protein
MHLMIKVKEMQHYFKRFQSLITITWLESWITDGVRMFSVPLALAVGCQAVRLSWMSGDWPGTLNITCNFLYCNHQVYRDS